MVLKPSYELRVASFGLQVNPAHSKLIQTIVTVACFGLRVERLKMLSKPKVTGYEFQVTS